MNKVKDTVIMIDMIKGFCQYGPLSSKNVLEISPLIEKFIQSALKEDIEIYHYVDSHTQDSKEFQFFPPHCLEGTSECEILENLRFPPIKVIKKNSTNGFLRFNPLKDDPKNLHIIGCVTDICIYDFATTAQKYKEEFNLDIDIIVYDDLTQTFDGDNHDSKTFHNNSLNKMKEKGIIIAHFNL